MKFVLNLSKFDKIQAKIDYIFDFFRKLLKKSTFLKNLSKFEKNYKIL
jgi:hypothetical protein